MGGQINCPGYGEGLKILWRRPSWVQVPPPAPDANLPQNLVNFSIWLLNKKGNRESTIKRKLRYVKFFSGNLDEITNQILNCSWKDKVKSNALDVVEQYAEFLKLAYERPNFRAYDTTEMYVPNPEMVKQFLYRVDQSQLKLKYYSL